MTPEEIEVELATKCPLCAGKGGTCCDYSGLFKDYVNPAHEIAVYRKANAKSRAVRVCTVRVQGKFQYLICIFCRTVLLSRSAHTGLDANFKRIWKGGHLCQQRIAIRQQLREQQ